ncbi:MAG: NINE protein [Acetobacteraceae bacterium]
MTHEIVFPAQAGRGSRAFYNEVFCRACGHGLHPRAPLCPQCGAPQAADPAAAEPAQKSKVAAALLAFFLGGFGVHKFYLGEIGLGVIYLLFCWTFIPAFVAVIEGIFYLAISDGRFAKRYG